MPYVSDAQRKFMHAKHPEIAKRWDKHTPKGKKLPEHVKKSDFGRAAGQAIGAAGNAVGQGLEAAGGGVSALLRKLNLDPGGALALGGMQPGTALKTLGAGAAGAGSIGAYGLYNMLKGKEKAEASTKPTPGTAESGGKEAAIGTAFTDGMLTFFLEKGLDGDQVATLLEKGATIEGRTGEECKSFIDRMLA